MMSKKVTSIYRSKKLTKLAVTYKGVFDMKNLYEFLHDWLLAEGFVADDKHAGPEDFEAFYWQRMNAQGMTDYSIWWRMKKEPDDHSTSWFEYRLNLDFLGIAIAKTDVMHEGKKVGAQKGEINFFIQPIITLDPDKLWEEDSFASRFAKTFMNKTYAKEFKFHKDIMEDLAFRLEEAIKDFLGLVTLTDLGEPFHPEKGLGWG